MPCILQLMKTATRRTILFYNFQEFLETTSAYRFKDPCWVSPQRYLEGSIPSRVKTSRPHPSAPEPQQAPTPNPPPSSQDNWSLLSRFHEDVCRLYKRWSSSLLHRTTRDSLQSPSPPWSRPNSLTTRCNSSTTSWVFFVNIETQLYLCDSCGGYLGCQSWISIQSRDLTIVFWTINPLAFSSHRSCHGSEGKIS